MGPLVRQSSDVFVFLGKHDGLFGMVGLWWCLVQLSLLGEYGVVCVQYCRIQNVDAWCSSSLPGLDLVFVGFYLHNKNWSIFFKIGPAS